MLLSLAASAVLVVAAVVAGLLLLPGSNRGASTASSDVPGQATPATSPPSSALASAPSGTGSGKKAGQHGAKPQVLRSVNCGPDPHLCGFPDATNTGVPAGVTLYAPVSVNIGTTSSYAVLVSADNTGTGGSLFSRLIWFKKYSSSWVRPTLNEGITSLPFLVTQVFTIQSWNISTVFSAGGCRLFPYVLSINI